MEKEDDAKIFWGLSKEFAKAFPQTAIEGYSRGRKDGKKEVLEGLKQKVLYIFSKSKNPCGDWIDEITRQLKSLEPTTPKGEKKMHNEICPICKKQFETLEKYDDHKCANLPIKEPTTPTKEG